MGQHSWSFSSEKLCNLGNEVPEAQGVQTASQRPQQMQAINLLLSCAAEKAPEL